MRDVQIDGTASRDAQMIKLGNGAKAMCFELKCTYFGSGATGGSELKTFAMDVLYTNENAWRIQPSIKKGVRIQLPGAKLCYSEKTAQRGGNPHYLETRYMAWCGQGEGAEPEKGLSFLSERVIFLTGKASCPPKKLDRVNGKPQIRVDIEDKWPGISPTPGQEPQPLKIHLIYTSVDAETQLKRIKAGSALMTSGRLEADNEGGIYIKANWLKSKTGMDEKGRAHEIWIQAGGSEMEYNRRAMLHTEISSYETELLNEAGCMWSGMKKHLLAAKCLIGEQTFQEVLCENKNYVIEGKEANKSIEAKITGTLNTEIKLAAKQSVKGGE